MYFLTHTIYCVHSRATCHESEAVVLKVLQVQVLKLEKRSPHWHSAIS